MQQKEIEAFIQWLPQNVEEFKDKTPEQCAEMLNEMSKTEEGMNAAQELFARFQKQAGMFKEGGKLGYLVNKFQYGGKYNRKAARARKQGLRPVDDYMAGSQNVLAKKAKAMNVDGFDESMYNMDPDQQFDRSRYRARKQEARELYPEYNRRQRKAYALMDNSAPAAVQLRDLPKQTRDDSWIGQTNRYYFDPMDNAQAHIDEVRDASTITPTKREIATDYEIRRSKYKPMSWDQFGTYAMNHMKASDAYTNGVDLATMQAYIENEYDKYRNQGLDYKWTNPEVGALLKVGSDWKSRYGAINTNANNWGNVDRSGTIDFSGNKSIGDIVDPDGKMRNYLRVDKAGEYTYDPEERTNARFESQIPTNQYNDNVNMRGAFADSDISAAGRNAMEAVGRIAGAGAVGGITSAIPVLGLAGFAGNYLSGAYTNAALAAEDARIPAN